MPNVKLTIPSVLGLLAAIFGTVLPLVSALPHSIAVPVTIIGAAVAAANEKLVQVTAK